MVYVANAKTGFCSRACVHAVRCSLFYPQAPLFPLTFTLKPCSEMSLLNSPTLNHLGLFWNFFLCWNYGAWFALSWMRSLKDCRSSLDAGEDGRSCLCSSLLLLLLNQIPCSFCREQRCNRCVAAPTPSSGTKPWQHLHDVHVVLRMPLKLTYKKSLNVLSWTVYVVWTCQNQTNM